MLTIRGLSEATDVVVSGSSAGGLHFLALHPLAAGLSHSAWRYIYLSVTRHCQCAGGLATSLQCDAWSERILTEGAMKAKVVCVPDSGLFLDYEGAPKYHSGMTWAFHQQNSSSGVDVSCIKSETPTSNCMFAEHTMKHISTPLFPLQSEYDSWQTAYDLGSADAAKINTYGEKLTGLVRTNLLNQKQHGIFLDNCHHHCGAWGHLYRWRRLAFRPYQMVRWE